jgi:hypothetical protein
MLQIDPPDEQEEPMSGELDRHRQRHKAATDEAGSDQPDVEAHRHRSRHKWAGDEGESKEPDVEAHRFVARHKAAGEDQDTGMNRFSGI